MSTRSFGKWFTCAALSVAALSVAALSSAGCAGPSLLVRRSIPVAARPAPGERVAIAPLDWADLRTGTSGDASFVEGSSVGHLAQSGGYRFDKELRAPRSSQVAVHDVDPYREQVRNRVDVALTSWMGRRRLVAATPIETAVTREAWSVGPGAIVPTDEKDNANMVPLALSWRSLAAVDADWVVVPVAVHAYSHNAAWFVGQTWGCPGGARVRVAVAWYSGRDGRLRGVNDIDIPVRDGVMQPNRYQALSYLDRALEGWVRTFESDAP